MAPRKPSGGPYGYPGGNCNYYPTTTHSAEHTGLGCGGNINDHRSSRIPNHSRSPEPLAIELVAVAGRPKAEVSTGAAEELAKFLRRLRFRSGRKKMTYKEMAEATGGRRYCSASTFSRADLGGDSVPRVETVGAYVLACGGTSTQLRQAYRLLDAAREKNQMARTRARIRDLKELSRIVRQKNFPTVEKSEYSHMVLQFQNALRKYRIESGSLSYRSIEANARAAGFQIPKSTAHRIISTETPLQWAQVKAFLVGCRPGHTPDLMPWYCAWITTFGP